MRAEDTKGKSQLTIMQKKKSKLIDFIELGGRSLSDLRTEAKAILPGGMEQQKAYNTGKFSLVV